MHSKSSFGDYNTKGCVFVNKSATSRKKMASLGIKKNENGDYEYIDPAEKDKSKYNAISCKPALLKTVEGNYKILVCEEDNKEHPL